jgi:hypothetical protein
MRKTIAFLAGTLVLAAFLAGTGCKSRDVKGLGLALGPVPPVATPSCPAAARYNLDGTGCWGDYSDDTYDNPSGTATECGFSGRQKVYEVVMTRSDYLYAYVYSYDNYVGISVRRNCNPGANRDDVIDCSCCSYDGDYYSNVMAGPLSAGTYYVVVDTPDGPADYYYGFCVGAP